jgi:hypothetical protein
MSALAPSRSVGDFTLPLVEALISQTLAQGSATNVFWPAWILHVSVESLAMT